MARAAWQARACTRFLWVSGSPALSYSTRVVHITTIPPGNVSNINKLLSTDERLKAIAVIGVGGVMSGLSARRMISAGANVVGLATALGREGVDVFERITYEVLDDLDSGSDF